MPTGPLGSRENVGDKPFFSLSNRLPKVSPERGKFTEMAHFRALRGAGPLSRLNQFANGVPVRDCFGIECGLRRSCRTRGAVCRSLPVAAPLTGRRGCVANRQQGPEPDEANSPPRRPLAG